MLLIDLPLLLLIFFFLCLTIVSLISICLSVFLLVCLFVCFHMALSVLPGIGWLFFFPMLEKFSAIISSSSFVRPFLFFFWDPYNADIGAINVSDISETVFISFYFLFFLNFVLWQWLPPLCLPAHLFVLLTHLFC